MAARIVEGLFTCAKRWALEAALKKAGHRFRHPRSPASGSECVCRILCWLDGRGDPQGRMHDATADDVENAAGWVGEPGVLLAALVATGWVDRTEQGLEWHDYGALNRLTLSDRQKKLRRDRRASPDSVGGRPRKGDRRGDQTRDQSGDQSGDQSRDRRGASESGDSSEGIPSDARARGASGAPSAPRVLPEAEPEVSPSVPKLFAPHPAVAQFLAGGAPKPSPQRRPVRRPADPPAAPRSLAPKAPA